MPKEIRIRYEDIDLLQIIDINLEGLRGNRLKSYGKSESGEGFDFFFEPYVPSEDIKGVEGDTWPRRYKHGPNLKEINNLGLHGYRMHLVCMLEEIDGKKSGAEFLIGPNGHLRRFRKRGAKALEERGELYIFKKVETRSKL